MADTIEVRPAKGREPPKGPPFDNAKDLEAWLQEKSKAAQVIAFRTALRVFPMVLKAIDFQEGEADTRYKHGHVIIQAFRCLVISRVIVVGTLNDTIKGHAYAAYANIFGGAVKAPDPAAARSTAYAAYATAYTNAAYAAAAAATAAAEAAGAAVDTTGSAGARRQIWQAISDDAVLLQSAVNVTELLEKRLWQQDVRGDAKYSVNFPIWARNATQNFAKEKGGKESPWSLVLDWYRAQLPNSRSGTPWDILGDAAERIALQPDEFWEDKPETVLENIMKIAGIDYPDMRLSKRGTIFEETPELSNTEPDTTADPVQQPGPKIVDKADPSTDEPTAIDMLGREPFAKALVKQINTVNGEGGYDGIAVHLHAQWGAGKTSVLMMMRDILQPDKAYISVRENSHEWFPHHPWVPFTVRRSIWLLWSPALLFLFVIGHCAEAVADFAKSLFSRPSSKDEPESTKRWVVVNFNAWEFERRNPPWWPMIHAVKDECTKCFRFSDDWKGARRLDRTWWIWKLKSDWFPLVVASLCGVLLLLVLFSGSVDTATSDGVNAASDADNAISMGTVLSDIAKLIGAAAVAFAAFVAAGRALFFGSDSNAKFYFDLSRDPMQNIKKLFSRIIEQSPRPVCIFIDDLDRCSESYVVDLLEGIQTSFRHGKVAYVVAADRAWIRTCFRDKYSKFADNHQADGQTIGYLFLEKIFQIATPLPGISEELKRKYWNYLLLKKRGEPSDENGTEAPIASPEFNPPTEEEISARVAELKVQYGEITGDKASEIRKENDSPTDVAALVEVLNETPSEDALLHNLARFVSLLPDNPRVMKRMKNAFSLRQSIGVMEGRTVPTAVLARWTILEQRFPALADILIREPEWVEKVAKGVDEATLDTVPEELHRYNAVRDIRRIIEGEPETVQGLDSDAPILTADHIVTITRGAEA